MVLRIVHGPYPSEFQISEDRDFSVIDKRLLLNGN
jgi:hypothetical protein